MTQHWTFSLDRLIDQNNIWFIIPSNEWSREQQIDALVRLTTITSIVISIFRRDLKFILIPIFVIIILYILKIDVSDKEGFQVNQTEKTHTFPTKENPMMNANIITDDRNRGPAAEIPSSVTREIMNQGFPKESGDIWNVDFANRQFITMPSTTFPNDREGFAKWCYDTGPTCKEESIKCTGNRGMFG